MLRFVKGDDAKAEALFQRALSIRERNLGVEHKDVTQALRNLAEFYQVKTDYKKRSRFISGSLRQQRSRWGRPIKKSPRRCSDTLV